MVLKFPIKLGAIPEGKNLLPSKIKFFPLRVSPYKKGDREQTPFIMRYPII